MANMSYCRFENTLNDLRACYHALEEGERLLESEEQAKTQLILLCKQIVEEFCAEDKNVEEPLDTEGFPTKTFAEFELEQARKESFGVVITGAGKPYAGWLTELNRSLIEAEITTVTPCFDHAYVLSDNSHGNNGRTDLVIFFSKESKLDIGKMAIWRLQFPKIKWTEDFVANYNEDYISGESE